MTQARGRARAKTNRGRSRIPRSTIPQEEELIHNERFLEDDNRKTRNAVPCKNIYVPPRIQQQERDDLEQFTVYSSSNDSGSRGRRGKVGGGKSIRRVPSVIQDTQDEDRQRNRRLRTRQLEEEAETEYSPNSYHGSPKRNKPPSNVAEEHEPHRQFLDRRMRGLSDEPVVNACDSTEAGRYRPQHRTEVLSGSASSYSSDEDASSQRQQDRRSKGYANQYGPSFSDGLTTNSYSDTYDTEGNRSSDHGSSRHYEQRLPIFLASVSTMASLESVTSMLDGDVGGPFAFLASDLSGLFSAKQDVAVCTMILSAIELLVVMLQLTMCGIAPFQMNMMVGPFPDAFSIWGGKNPHLMLVENEWWRVVTPSVLSVGILHYAINVYCLLGTGALFEREWGWMPWVFFLIIGSVGCSAFSLYFEPDTIAVGSSGALLGLYGAKLAQIILQTFCQAPKKRGEEQEIIPLGYLGSVLFALILLFLLGIIITYIDFVGSCGGLLAGFSAGLIYFSYLIDGCCWRFLITVIGFCALIVPVGTFGYLFVTETETNEELADVCEYFRSLFTEEYECGCMG